MRKLCIELMIILSYPGLGEASMLWRSVISDELYFEGFVVQSGKFCSVIGVSCFN